MDYRKLNNELQNLMQKGMAWESIDIKTDEAQAYCQKYIIAESWGKNVWHCILEDAIRMRKELEAKINSERDFPHSNTDMGS